MSTPAKTPKPKKGRAGSPQPAVASSSQLRLKAGDKVTIYVDPITREIPEGKAELLFPINEKPGPSGMEFWQVRFPDAPGSYRRHIMPEAAAPDSGRADSPQPAVSSDASTSQPVPPTRDAAK